MVYRVASAVLVAVALSASVPITNFRYYAQAVTGTVMTNGQAVQNAQVIVTGKFADEVRKVNTDGAALLQRLRAECEMKPQGGRQGIGFCAE